MMHPAQVQDPSVLGAVGEVTPVHGYYATSDRDAIYDLGYRDAAGHLYGRSTRTGVWVRVTRTGERVRSGQVRVRIEFAHDNGTPALVYGEASPWGHVGGVAPASLFGP